METKNLSQAHDRKTIEYDAKDFSERMKKLEEESKPIKISQVKNWTWIFGKNALPDKEVSA